MTFVNLCNNKIGLNGAEHLCSCLQNVEMLNLCMCGIPTAGCTLIEEKLHQLDLPVSFDLVLDNLRVTFHSCMTDMGHWQDKIFINTFLKLQSVKYNLM